MMMVMALMKPKKESLVENPKPVFPVKTGYGSV
jgi:hypothetical protein